MIFSSVLFIFFFLPAVLVFYYCINDRFRNIFLFIASLFFYAWGEPVFITIMIISIIINYFFGFLVSPKQRVKKIFLIFAVSFNIGLLFVFKYLNFTVDILNHFLKNPIIVKTIPLPIGISFFTFQILSYIIDVYKGNAKTQKNIISLGLYIALFPQLIAGPIVRYIDIEREIKGRFITTYDFYEGIRRFIIGFSKKVLIADLLAPLADSVFSGSYPSLYGHWVGIIAYTLQIYYDFSGYSDMAIGMGRMFGFHFFENFNYPYISSSIREFWRRWHISLSTWFRDYLYIPLGGSRKGNIHTYINLMVVFLLTGLWHGASLNFIVWGLWYALFLIVERTVLGEKLKIIPSVLQHIYVIIVVMIGWVFFKANTLLSAIEYIKGMFYPYGGDWIKLRMLLNPQLITCILAGVIFSIPIPQTFLMPKPTLWHKIMNDFSLFAIFIIAICYLVGSGYSPFLYFRF